MRSPAAGLLLAFLFLPGLAGAEGLAWLAADVGAPYVALAAGDRGAEVATLQFLVTQDHGAALDVRVRSTDPLLAELFGAGAYRVARATGEVLDAAPGSLAQPGQRLGWWLDPSQLPQPNATVPLLGRDHTARAPEERDGVALLTLRGPHEGTLEGPSPLDEPRRASFLVVRSYRVADGLLQSAEVLPEGAGEGDVPLVRVDLAAAGPVQGALPPELATFALLGPGAFAAGFVAMLLARRRYLPPGGHRRTRFCTQCGTPAAQGGACADCGAPAGGP
jgi:hypothetical protein